MQSNKTKDCWLLFWLGVCSLIALCSSSSHILFKKGAPIVVSESGTYQGIVRQSRGNRSYYEFLGIRYADPPPLRLMPATLHVGDSGDTSQRQVQHAVKAGSRCPQQFGGSLIGTEDCYFLNLHVPMRQPSDKEGFPVMVWIHGGSYTFGSGDSYQAKYFMDEDVIVVTINYRLGALGFLSMEDDVIPGNLGLRDQILALQWLKNNIKYFDGDPKRLTIFGNSAGAASVHSLMLSPMNKGLFQSAIAQSGSIHNFWAFQPSPKERARKFGSLLGCETYDSEFFLECIQEKSVVDIVSAQAKMKDWYVDPISPFGPTVEFHEDDPFLPDHPHEIIERREFMRVPLMIGITQDEGLSVSSVGVANNEKLVAELDENFLTLAPIAFNYKAWFPSKDLKEISKMVRDFYFGKKKIDMRSMQNLTNLYSDANFVFGVWKFALEHATEKPVYPYILSFMDEESQSLTKLSAPNKYGVAHGDELQYLFKCTLFSDEAPHGSKVEAFSQKLVKLWASFAKHKKPIDVWGKAQEWPPISKAQLEGNKPFLWYRLDEETSLVENPFLDRKIFWDKIFKKFSTRNIVRDEL